ncbi:MAG: hypothetical protein IIZ93_15290 [Acidaminococcaceae bacterium]|nr:hypothetical protein [Acidaminococcaceae bacterium]
MKGKLKDLSLTMDGRWNLTLTIDGECRPIWDKYKDKEIDIDIKAHRNKRSLDANGYAWVLMDKIAARMHIDKVEVYREAIKNIGGVSETVCVQDKAVDRLRQGWEQNGIGWQTDTMPSKLKGCTNVILYYGSSTYDTQQMSLLIDHIVQDAKALGIETMTPAELEALKIA